MLKLNYVGNLDHELSEVTEGECPESWFYPLNF
jgi:hypothetical protein